MDTYLKAYTDCLNFLKILSETGEVSEDYLSTFFENIRNFCFENGYSNFLTNLDMRRFDSYIELCNKLIPILHEKIDKIKVLETAGSNLYKNLLSSFYGKFDSLDLGFPAADISTHDMHATAVIRPIESDAISKLDEQKLEQMKKQISISITKLNDLTADVMDVLNYIWLERASDPSKSVFIHADDILSYRGLARKKNHYVFSEKNEYGYRIDQREEIKNQIQLLDSTWIKYVEFISPKTGKGKFTTLAGETKAIQISSRFGEVNEKGDLDPFLWQIRPSNVFLPFLIGDKKQTYFLTQKVLEYNPRTQALEKRLARYFHWQWPIKNRFNNFEQPYKVKTLFNAANYEIDKRFLKKNKERLVKALNTLKEDRLISDWKFADDVINMSYDEYVDTIVYVFPPDEIITKYRIDLLLEDCKKYTKVVINEDYISALTQYMNKNNLRLRALAAEIGTVSYRTIHRFLSGESISAASMKKIVSFLNSKK